MKLQGSIVALVTPFKNHHLCTASFDTLLELHLKAGTHGILIAGTTGEAATQSETEILHLISHARSRVGDAVPLLAGTGSFSTEATCERTKRAADAGADVALVVTPYYNKPTQAGLIAHFERVADSAPIPILLYNVPSRTGVNLLPQSVITLCAHPNIIGIKEASGSCGQAAEILRGTPEAFLLLSGDDKINFPLMAMGAHGAISVVANVLPQLFARFMNHALAHEWEAARTDYFATLPLCNALFYETNPAPAKEILFQMGLLSSRELRPPLVPVGQETRTRLAAIVEEFQRP